MVSGRGNPKAPRIILTIASNQCSQKFGTAVGNAIARGVGVLADCSAGTTLM